MSSSHYYTSQTHPKLKIEELMHPLSIPISFENTNFPINPSQNSQPISPPLDRHTAHNLWTGARPLDHHTLSSSLSITNIVIFEIYMVWIQMILSFMRNFLCFLKIWKFLLIKVRFNRNTNGK